MNETAIKSSRPKTRLSEIYKGSREHYFTDTGRKTLSKNANCFKHKLKTTISIYNSRNFVKNTIDKLTNRKKTKTLCESNLNFNIKKSSQSKISQSKNYIFQEYKKKSAITDKLLKILTERKRLYRRSKSNCSSMLRINNSKDREKLFDKYSYITEQHK